MKKIGGVFFLAIYLLGPVVASILEIGDRAGPKIYPRALHEFVYSVTWEVTSHQGMKPRLPAVFQSDLRPWFYGMYSPNNDPEWVKAEFVKLKERLSGLRE